MKKINIFVFAFFLYLNFSYAETHQNFEDWKKKFKNIKRLDVIEGAGHCPHDEEPEETNRLICEFLQETK